MTQEKPGVRFCGRYVAVAHQAGRSLVLLVNCYTAFVAADEPCEAASGGEAVVNPDVEVTQEKPGARFCGRYVAVAHQTRRSLVLFVNCYTAFVAADEPCEAASGGEAVVNPDVEVTQEKPGARFCGRYVAVAHQTDRSLVLLVSDYKAGNAPARSECCLVPSDDVQLFSPVNDCSHTPPRLQGGRNRAGGRTL